MRGSKKCVVVRAYGAYRKGDIIWPPGALRDELLRSGYIELAQDAGHTDMAAVVQTAAPPREAAMRRRRAY